MTDLTIEKLIELHKETLMDLRAAWLADKQLGRTNTADKAMARIDKALDYLKKLMDARDGDDNNAAPKAQGE